MVHRAVQWTTPRVVNRQLAKKSPSRRVYVCWTRIMISMFCHPRWQDCTQYKDSSSALFSIKSDYPVTAVVLIRQRCNSQLLQGSGFGWSIGTVHIHGRECFVHTWSDTGIQCTVSLPELTTFFEIAQPANDRVEVQVSGTAQRAWWDLATGAQSGHGEVHNAVITSISCGEEACSEVDPASVTIQVSRRGENPLSSLFVYLYRCHLWQSHKSRLVHHLNLSK